MQSRWVDRDAKAAVDRGAAVGVSYELALRIYTTRLLGGDPALFIGNLLRLELQLAGGSLAGLRAAATHLLFE